MIGQWIVRVADLAEAEARNAKRGVFRLAVALVALVAALGFLCLGMIVIAAAIYVALLRVIPTDAACAVIGVILLIIGGVSAVIAGKLGCTRKPRDEVR